MCGPNSMTGFGPRVAASLRAFQAQQAAPAAPPPEQTVSTEPVAQPASGGLFSNLAAVARQAATSAPFAAPPPPAGATQAPAAAQPTGVFGGSAAGLPALFAAVQGAAPAASGRGSSFTVR